MQEGGVKEAGPLQKKKPGIAPGFSFSLPLHFRPLLYAGFTRKCLFLVGAIGLEPTTPTMSR